MAIMPSRQLDLTLGQKLWQVNWGLVFLITVTASVGFGMLYSAANGEFAPWATRQMMRFGVGLVLMIIVAVSNIHFWLRYAYIIYIASFSSLIFVELFGSVAQPLPKLFLLPLVLFHDLLLLDFKVELRNAGLNPRHLAAQHGIHGSGA